MLNGLQQRVGFDPADIKDVAAGCGSGQQAVSFAAMGVMSGQQEAVIGGGVEFMSRYAPVHAAGFHANNEHLRRLHPQVPQGKSADLIPTLEGFSREEGEERM